MTEQNLYPWEEKGVHHTQPNWPELSRIAVSFLERFSAFPFITADLGALSEHPSDTREKIPLHSLSCAQHLPWNFFQDPSV